jgi:diketogulonate reductase-like aldo/keto reductase
LTPAQLALAWVLSRGEHVHAISGTTNVSHLETNLAALRLLVPALVLKEVGALINQQSVSGHRYPAAMRKTIDTEDFVSDKNGRKEL